MISDQSHLFIIAAFACWMAGAAFLQIRQVEAPYPVNRYRAIGGCLLTALAAIAFALACRMGGQA